MRRAADASSASGQSGALELSVAVAGTTLRVELANEKWDGPGLDLKTVNGGVTLAVPTGFSGELDARTSNGGISVDFPITITGVLNNRRQISGTLGSGGSRIRLSAVNGGISISRR